jgi:hypothetical protein
MADAALGNARNISLVTFRKDGRAVATPVWPVALDGKLYVNTDARSWKVRRLRRSPRVRVAPCTMRGTVTAAYLEGTGRVLDDPALAARVNGALRFKYGWQTALTPLLGLFSRRFRERVILELTL